MKLFVIKKLSIKTVSILHKNGISLKNKRGEIQKYNPEFRVIVAVYSLFLYQYVTF
jgi:phage terminase Nu1 subunit (DNA packaging protein)